MTNGVHSNRGRELIESVSLISKLSSFSAGCLKLSADDTGSMELSLKEESKSIVRGDTLKPWV